MKRKGLKCNIEMFPFGQAKLEYESFRSHAPT